MERRNLQLTGGSSYVVTLPKSWIQSQSLTERGTVDIHELPAGQLLITPSHAQTATRATVTIDYLTEPQLLREIIGLFVSGAEEIIVQANSITYEQRALVRSISHKLFGFELFEQTSQQIILRNVASTRITAPDFCSKMVGLIHSMFLDVVTAVAAGDQKLAKDIVERDVEVDRIHLVILRQFHRMLTTLVREQPTDLPLLDLHYYEHVAIRLERIADHLVRIASTMLVTKDGSKVQLNKFEHANLTKLHEYFSLLQEVIQATDKRKAHRLLDLYESHPKNEYMRVKHSNRSSLSILIEESIERIRSYMANIAEETINYTSVKSLTRIPQQ